MEEMSVDKYLNRICYTGSLDTTVATLTGLALAHKKHIPFTNVHLFGGPHIHLDLKLIYNKVIIQKSGAICFEMNVLFMWLLKEVGFDVHYGQSSFLEQDRFSPPFNHILPLILISGDYYYCDPAWLTTVPMKCVSMMPHVATHGIYRLRNIPGKDDSWFLVERHKKTVLDAKGNVLKQGPGVPGAKSGYCNEECAKAESDHWGLQFKFSMTPESLCNFMDCCENLQSDPNNVLQNGVYMLRLEAKMVYIAVDRSYSIKKCVDPNTDQILEQVEFRDDQHVVDVAREVFKCSLQHTPNFFSREKKKHESS